MDTTPNTLLAEVTQGGLWFPTDAAASNQVDDLTYFILIICGFFLVFNAGLMVFFAVRYRQKKKEGVATGATHNTALEVTWSIIPAFILAIIFIWGFRGFLHQETPPDNAYDILVTGYKWGWDFTYPDGVNAKPIMKHEELGAETVPGLHVPPNRPIRLTLQSRDVIHSVFIKQMRVKKDCVPGRWNQMWFEANYDEATAYEFELPTMEGGTTTVKCNVYDLFCTEYCGQNHSMMITKVYVYASDEDYEKWYQAKALTDPGTPLVELGKSLWTGKCASCHSIDGKKGTGPSWKDLYMKPSHALTDGTILADDAYIIESIRNPGAKLAAGFGNAMPAFNESQLSNRDVRALIEFMKQNSTHAEADDGLTYGDLNVDGSLKEGETGPEGEGGGEGEEAAPEGEGDESAPEGEYEAAALAG